MTKFPALSAKLFLKSLLSHGCIEISINGSHHKVKNPLNNKTSAVPVHGGGTI